MSDSGVLALGVAEAAAVIREGQLTATDYVGLVLDRCQALARLNAFITVDAESARAEAARVDDRRRQGRATGELAGVPIVVKDNIDVTGFPTTAGTPALRDHHPRRDADVVARLRDAGAIVVGKTNMHELAAGVTTDNRTYGTARNPYREDHVPGGSSGGTAIAVAARIVPAGLGTDTGGSNRIPAAHCGVVGFRPGTGRWPQSGLALNSPLRDTAGPLARSVADCALLDAVVTGDRGPARQPALDGLRLGVPRSQFWSDLADEVEQVAQARLGELHDAGVTLVDVEILDLAPLTAAAGFALGVGRHAAVLGHYLRQSGSRLAPADVFSAVASVDVKQFLGEWLPNVSPHAYAAARDVQRPALRDAYRTTFEAGDLDALVFPTVPVPAPRIAEDLLDHRGRSFPVMEICIRNTNAGSVAGLPGLSIPAGLTRDGLPVGLALDGPVGHDRQLLAIGRAVEAAMPRLPAPPY